MGGGESLCTEGHRATNSTKEKIMSEMSNCRFDLSLNNLLSFFKLSILVQYLALDDRPKGNNEFCFPKTPS